jgi:glycosyltransferase involved in cell wall biosynthesis
MERLSFERFNALQQFTPANIIPLTPDFKPNKSRPVRLLQIIHFLFTIFPKSLSQAKHADIIFLADPLLSKLGWLIKLIFKKPIAITVHGLDITYPNFFYQLYLRLFFRKFDLYLPISNHAAQLLKQHKISGQVHVKNQLLTIGRLERRKGHAWFIQNVLPQLTSTTEYLIAGTGPEFEHIKNINHPQVKLLGRVSDQELSHLLNTATAFIQPNLATKFDTEGFGLVLLEAALCQLPVFASRLEGITDAIQDPHNGTLLPAQNASAWIKTLDNFLKDPQPNNQARDYTLKKFNWEKQAQVFYSALTQVTK